VASYLLCVAPLLLLGCEPGTVLALVSKDEQLAVSFGGLFDLVQPVLFQHRERLHVFHVVDQNDGVGITVVALDHAAEPLLSGGIPKLQFDEAPFDVDGPT
jgi:hypothetical protein